MLTVNLKTENRTTVKLRGKVTVIYVSTSGLRSMLTVGLAYYGEASNVEGVLQVIGVEGCTYVFG